MIDPLWVVVIGFIVAFFLAFGVGANDVANSFGTSVGSKVLTLRNACILASIFELLGAVLFGSQVSDTVRKNIFELERFENEPNLLMVGNLVALASSAIWTLLATYFGLPISGTHSIVGSMVGIALVSKGWGSIYWKTLAGILTSWCLTPVLSGVISVVIFKLMQYFILKKEKVIEPGLRSLPIFFGITIFIYAVFVLHGGPEWLKLEQIPIWIIVVGSLSVAVITALLIWFIWVPRLRASIIGADYTIQDASSSSPEQTIVLMTNFNSKDVDLKEGNCVLKKEADPIKDEEVLETMLDKNGGIPSDELSPQKEMTEYTAVDIPNSESTTETSEKEPDDSPEIVKVFSPLQIMTAICGSFAHGANDVSNAIGPLISLWLIYQTGTVASNDPIPIYILAFGGLGIIIGLWTLGRSVIKTMGEDLTKITPSSGFAIEIGAALTVLVASKLGLPISTTHCKVGSVAFVGVVRSSRGFKGVDWTIFKQIVLAWITTLPVSCALSALGMYLASFLV